MRFAPLFAMLVATPAMIAGPGHAAPAMLSCPPADALAERLCVALRQVLDQRQPTALPRLTLEAGSPRADMLRARLIVGEGASRREGPALELTVMDRAVIPDSQLQRLARHLLDQTLSDNP